MTSDRPIAKSCHMQAAIEELKRCAGTHKTKPASLQDDAGFVVLEEYLAQV